MNQENHKPDPHRDDARKAWERDMLTPAIQQVPDDEGERSIVGVNKFQHEEAALDYNIFTVPEDAEWRQIEDLRKTKSRRDQDKVHRALDAIGSVAPSEDNLIPPILDVVRLYASVGEICQALQNVFGEHRETYH